MTDAITPALRALIRTKSDLDCLRRSLHDALSQGNVQALFSTLISDPAIQATLTRVVGKRRNTPFKMRDIEPLVAQMLGFRTYHEAAHYYQNTPQLLQEWQCEHVYDGGKDMFSFYCPTGFIPNVFELTALLDIPYDGAEFPDERLHLTPVAPPVLSTEIATQYEHLGLDNVTASLVLIGEPQALFFMQSKEDIFEAFSIAKNHVATFASPDGVRRVNTQPMMNAGDGRSDPIHYERESTFWHTRVDANAQRSSTSLFNLFVHDLVLHGLGWGQDAKTLKHIPERDVPMLPSADINTYAYPLHNDYLLLYSYERKSMLIIDDQGRHCVGLIALG